VLRKLLTLFLFLLITACSAVQPSAPTAGLPRVLAVESFLADIAQNVAGDRLEVESLLPPGVDAHAYQPVPRDAAKVADSDVLLVNGAGYETFLAPLLKNAAGQRLLIEASAGLTPERGGDPHFWLDPTLVIRYVENIRAGLAHADPGGAAVYAANAAAYIEQLKALDGWIVTQLAQTPPQRRLLVTDHESLGYFAERYGFTVVGTVVPGLSSEAAPSAQQMAALIERIKSSGAAAIFLNITDNPQLAEQIASETGVRVVADLYIESLSSPDGPAPTYIEMMKHNVTRIVSALNP